ncbi:cytochrome P450 [Geopyxis carbonaria]|nr:cytochrome P450 [Geopyxis carbonaria]
MSMLAITTAGIRNTILDCWKQATPTWEFVFIVINLILITACYGSFSKKRVSVPSYGVPWYPLGSWVAAIRFIHNSAQLIEGGYQIHHPKHQAFKIATPSRWVVVATSPAVLKQLSENDPSVLSQQAAANERNSISYILSSSIHSDPFHVPLITKNLTLGLSKVIPDLVEGLSQIFCVDNPAGEWIAIDVYALVLKSLSATTNRILVGKELAADSEYLHSVSELAESVSRTGLLMVPRNRGPFKTFLYKVGRLFIERRQKLQELGDEWKDRPNDAIQWILESAPPSSSIYELSVRILYLDFSAIHTTYVSIINILHDLAAHPHFQAPLRREINTVLAAHGGVWSKAAFDQMKKLDSTVRESQRLHPVTTATMMRRAQRPVTLADGTTLPVGQWVVAPAWAHNRASHGVEYDAFRHEDSRSRTGADISFWMGRQACPGRFFAQMELKILLAWVLVNYDFGFDDGDGSILQGKGQGRPRNRFFSFSCLPDVGRKMVLRKKSVEED